MPLKPEQLETCLFAFGLPCTFKGIKQAPRITTYFFDYKNIAKATPAKTKAAAQKLSMLANMQIDVINSTVSHFALCHAENNRPIVNISELTFPENKSNEFVAGITEDNKQLNISFDKALHILIAGTTGSGKSVFINNLLYTLTIKQQDINNIRYAIIDKKRTLNFWNNLGFSMGIANDDKTALMFIKEFRKEMYSRYEKMQAIGIEKNKGQFPKWILVIDELADLMLTDYRKEIDENLVSLCQLGRAAGIHCVLATQAPRVSVISGLIQANTPTKIIFKTASAKESVLCLGHKGAEELLGNGDCIIKLPDSIKEYRVQTPYASNDSFKQALGLN